MRDDGNPDLEMMFVIAHKKKCGRKNYAGLSIAIAFESGLPIDTNNITNKNISKKLFREK